MDNDDTIKRLIEAGNRAISDLHLVAFDEMYLAPKKQQAKVMDSTKAWQDLISELNGTAETEYQPATLELAANGPDFGVDKPRKKKYLFF